MVDFDRGKGVEMQPQHFIAIHEFGSLYCVLRTHREIVSDGQQGHVDAGASDQRHITE